MLKRIFKYLVSFFYSKKTIQTMQDLKLNQTNGSDLYSQGYLERLKNRTSELLKEQSVSKITKEDLDIVKSKASEEIAVAYLDQARKDGDHDYKTWLSDVLKKKYDNPRIDEEYLENYAKYKRYQVYLNSSFSDQDQPTSLNYVQAIFNQTCGNLTEPKNSQNPFFRLYRDGVNKINTPSPMTSNAQSDFYVHSSKIDGHASYFIFEVDKQTNNLKTISYCDGNPVAKDRLISDKQINGVSTFHVRNDLKFNQEYVNKFIKTNSQDQTQEQFYKEFRTNSLNFLQASVNQADKHNSIATQQSKRGNCGIKSINLLQRFLIDKTSDISSQDQKNFYKDFKKQLTLSSLDQVVAITNKAFESDYPPFNQNDSDPLKTNALESLKKYNQKAHDKGDAQAIAILQKLSSPLQQLIGASSSNRFQKMTSLGREMGHAR